MGTLAADQSEREIEAAQKGVIQRKLVELFGKEEFTKLPYQDQVKAFFDALVSEFAEDIKTSKNTYPKAFRENDKQAMIEFIQESILDAPMDALPQHPHISGFLVALSKLDSRSELVRKTIDLSPPVASDSLLTTHRGRRRPVDWGTTTVVGSSRGIFQDLTQNTGWWEKAQAQQKL
jgi:hypothetical protein